MFARWQGRFPAVLLTTLTACVSFTGCLCKQTVPPAVSSAMPTELHKMTLPEHVIAPPDVLLLDAVTLVPRPPYRTKPLDSLFIQVTVFEPLKEDKGARPTLLPGQ